MIDRTKMDELFGSLDKSMPVAILCHRYADPDALGSAAGFAVLLKDVYGLSSKTYAAGTISHPQNKTLKNILHIKLEDAKDFNASKVSAVVVLDSDLANTGLQDKVSIVSLQIDHHTQERECPCLLSDVRIIGSASTIVFEYLAAFGVDLSKHTEAIVGMALGIKTDTLDFTSDNTTIADIDAFRLLLPFADKTLMARIIKYPLSEHSFEIEAKAFKDREQRGTTLFSYIGDVSSARHMIASVADSFLRLDSIETAIVIGLVENDLTVSIRNEDARVELGDIINRVFGKERGGSKGYSGGAMFNLGPVSLIADKKIREMAIQEIVNGFKQRLFEVLGEKTEDEAVDK